MSSNNFKYKSKINPHTNQLQKIIKKSSIQELILETLQEQDLIKNKSRTLSGYFA